MIYNSLIKRIVMSSLQGINGTIFMYGQTGSGKTFTMLGSHNFGEADMDEEGLQLSKRGVIRRTSNN